MVADWVIATVITLALNVAAYLIAPRSKRPRPAAVKELESPTADAGRPIPKVFGRKIVKSPNVLWYGDKQARTEEVKL